MRLLIKEITERIEFLDDIILKIRNTMKNAPEGRVRLGKSHGCTQYYHITNKEDKVGKYIRSKNRKLAEQLILKDYYKRVAAKAEAEIKVLNSLVRFYDSGTAEDIYAAMIPARRNLITPIWLSDEEYAKKWLAQDYERKGFDDDAPEHYTDMNERVRSKSEVLIANRLSAKGAPRIYELPLVINGKTIHPDFTVLNVRTRCVYIWEHLGMMDDPEYFESAIRRLMEYKKAGYYIGVNLIITFETSEHPLNVKEIDAMIENFLL